MNQFGLGIQESQIGTGRKADSMPSVVGAGGGEWPQARGGAGPQGARVAGIGQTCAAQSCAQGTQQAARFRASLTA